MAEETKGKVIDAEATETDKKEEKKEKKSILKKAGEVAGECKPICGKAVKFVGKIFLGTITVLSTIGLIAAATPTKKYYTPNSNKSDGTANTDNSGNSEPETYHGEVVD